MKPTKKKNYTISEAARKLGITKQAIHEAVRRGRLEAFEGEITQRVLLIPAEALKAYRVSLSHKQRGKKT